MKTVLIAGGAGCIGSHLCDRLVNRGEMVICLDNLLTGSQKNIAHLLAKNNFYFQKHDITELFTSKKFSKID